jgi:hypothetical protein
VSWETETERERLIGKLADEMDPDGAREFVDRVILEAVNWQPIETAPKDGRTVLVFKRTEPCWSIVGLAFWFGGENDTICGWMSYGIPRLDQEPNTLGLAHPTHWMPLPEPPA